MLTVAFGESTMSRTQVQLWYNQSTSTTAEYIEAVKQIIVDNHRITIREVADDVGISFGSWQTDFYEYFRHERCGSEDCFKIAKF